MILQMSLRDITVEVELKAIRRINLYVHRDGRVRVSAPVGTYLDKIRRFVLSKYDWIKKSQARFAEQLQTDFTTKGTKEQEGRQQRIVYGDGEKHYLWGRPYTLRIAARGQAQRGQELSTLKAPDPLTPVELADNDMLLHVRQPSTIKKRREIVEDFYRQQLQNAAVPLIEKWQRTMGVKVRRLFIRRMKTKWGTCHVQKGNIRLNTDLARRPLHCLEYVIVHELAHLIERGHNARFKAVMDRFMPQWRNYRKELRQTGASS